MLKISADDSQAVAISDAIRSGDLSALRQQLNANPSLAGARIVDRAGVGRTLVHIAADWPGHFPHVAESVEILVAAGADVNATLQNGPGSSAETALHWAASSDDVALLDALLDHGASIEAQGAVLTGGSPMADAVVFAQWRAARRLLERGARTTLWQAAALGQLAAVQRSVGDQPTVAHDDLTNALWHSCRGGQFAVAQYLVQQGANAAWVGHDCKTPQDVARESGVAELIAWLNTLDTTSGTAGRPDAKE
jgi:uncharacterized protein